jgi:hypothetical protein
MQPFGYEDSANLSLRDNLFRRIRLLQDFSYKKAGFYRFVNGFLRISIITLAALVAAGEKIKPLVPAQPYLAVGIVIMTGIETWLVAGSKWKAHYRYNDDYIAFETELSATSNDQIEELQALRRKLDEIDAAYRREVLST